MSVLCVYRGGSADHISVVKRPRKLSHVELEGLHRLVPLVGSATRRRVQVQNLPGRKLQVRRVHMNYGTTRGHPSMRTYTIIQ